MNEVEDIDVEDAVFQGTESGNLNINNNQSLQTNQRNEAENDEYRILMESKEAREAQEKHANLLKQMEQKRIKQNLRVPTDDNEVKQRLRALEQPICYFGEEPADRRERLKELIASMTADGKSLPQFRKDRKQLNIDLIAISEKINQNRPYFEQGHPWLKIVRQKILKYSLKRSKVRLEKQREMREHPLPLSTKRENENELQSKLKNFCCQSSYYSRELSNTKSKQTKARPFSCLSISPKLNNISNIWEQIKIEEENIVKNELSANDEIENIGEYLVIFGNFGGDISIWDENGNFYKKYKAHDERITSVAVKPRSINIESIRFLTCSADRDTILWNANGDELARFSVHVDRLARCSYHPIGDYFGVASYDRSWSFWDINKEHCILRQEGHSSEVYCIDFQCDGSLVATGDLGGVIRIWDCRTGRAILGLDKHALGVLDVNFNVDGYTLASCSVDNTVCIWDLRKMCEKYSLPAHFNLVSGVKYEQCNGKWLVSSSFDKTIKIWSARTFQLIHTLEGHHSRISGVDINDDASFIVTCSHDKTWKLWSTDNFMFGKNEYSDVFDIFVDDVKYVPKKEDIDVKMLDVDVVDVNKNDIQVKIENEVIIEDINIDIQNNFSDDDDDGDDDIKNSTNKTTGTSSII